MFTIAKLDLTTFLARPSIAEADHVAGVLYRGRGWLAAGSAACLVIASVYLVRAERAYKASAQILVIKQGGRPLNVVDRDPNRGGFVDDVDEIPTQAMILRSPLVVARAIEDAGLENVPSVSRKGGGINDAVDRAIKNLTVTRPDRVAKVLQVDYLAGSRAEAVATVAAIIKSYDRTLESSFRSDNSEVVGLITRVKGELSKELKDLEREYQTFRAEHPVLIADGSGRPFVNRRLDQWDLASGEAVVRAVQLKSQLALGRKLAADGVGLNGVALAMGLISGRPTGGADAASSFLTREPPPEYLRQLEHEQQQSAELYGATSTRVKEIKEQVDRVRVQAKGARKQVEGPEIDDLLGAIEESVKSIESMHDDLDARFESDLAAARKVEVDLMTETNLKGRLERQRALFNTVVDQLKQAELVGDYGSISARTIDPPDAPSAPVRPAVALTSALAAAAGLVLGAGAALAAEAVDPRFRSLRELRRLTGLPVVGQVPQLADLGAGLISRTSPRSLSAESYKRARTNLESARRDRGVKVVMVASPNRGEGKSTVASNLAISLAQAGRHVLLVDADLRHPSQHRLHGARRDRGLVHVLRGERTMADVVQSSAVRNLDVVASGPDVDDPSELLCSIGLRAFLDEARRAYETVIVDAGPLVTAADPSVVAASADAVILVVRASTTTRDDAARALEILGAQGTPVLGTLVNGVGPAPSVPPAIERDARPAFSTEVKAEARLRLGSARPAGVERNQISS